MQTPYLIGAGNAEEALDQAPYLMERDPEFYRSVEDVLESYALNMRQTEGITNDNVNEAERGFLDVLKRHGITYVPHG